MKRAFDANVSRSKPRTRTATAEQVVERDPETGLSADLAAALVGPRAAMRSRAGGEARRAGMIADVAGGAAAAVSRGASERPVRDALLHTEQGLAEQAGEAAHVAARETEGADRSGHRAKLAQAMRMAAARVAEAAAEVTARQPPEWVVRAAVPGEDLGLIGMGPGAAAPEARMREASMAGTNAGGRTPTRTTQETVTAPAKQAVPTPAPRASTQSVPVPAAAKPVAAAAKPAEAPVASRVVTTEAPVMQTVMPAAPAPAAHAATPAAPAPVARAAVPVAPAIDAAAIEAAARAAIDAPRPRLAAPGEETVAQGRARIAEIRGRLAATVRPRITAEEVAPETATAAVRRAVDELRARLGAALAERDQLARTLESTRDELSAANRELAGRTSALDAAQALAAERARLAEELASEAEALAEERDQALSRILELKALDEQQTRLLADAEEALGQRDRLLADADRELQDLAAALDARAAEAEELAALLEERTKERDSLLGKVERLESDVRRLTGTREALAEIQRLVSSAASR